MKFKLGDKVKFLNEPGGGVVSKIISTSMVHVTIEEGFDIPVLNSELVIVDSSSHSAEMFREDYKVEVSQEDNEDDPFSEDRVSKIERQGKQGVQEEGIYLVFYPHDQKWLLTGMLDIYIINHTNTEILFSFFLMQKDSKEFRGIDYGSLLPYSKYLLDSIEQDQVRHWIKGATQVLFHKDTSSLLLPPVSIDFNIKSSRFANESQYQESAFISGKSIIERLTGLPVVKQFASEKPVTEAPQALEKKAKRQRVEQLIDKYMISRDEAVVDLHIGQVIDDLTDLSPHDMLNVQLDHFSKCLENAMDNGLRKITFIHGVGNGTLKEAIIDKMKDYEKLEHQSASLAKFGVGAVDILIYHNQ